MQYKEKTITSFQKVYHQITGENLTTEQASDEIRKLYEDVVLTAMQPIPVSDQNKYSQLIKECHDN